MGVFTKMDDYRERQQKLHGPLVYVVEYMDAANDRAPEIIGVSALPIGVALASMQSGTTAGRSMPLHEEAWTTVSDGIVAIEGSAARRRFRLYAVRLERVYS